MYTDWGGKIFPLILLSEKYDSNLISCREFKKAWKEKGRG